MMRVRIINHVNYIEYAEVEVKDQGELDKLYEDGFEGVDWEPMEDDGETTHEIIDEEKNDE
tara:strand:+ start:2686 stop:2868 length:183 start_codon:yes stop_codon:yes gene_type:complete